MIIQNTANGRMTEYNRYDDILENAIKLNKLNSTELERHLARVNKGSKRRLHNNHALRLAQFKGKN